jgi:CRP-like cAMP-binding protein
MHRQAATICRTERWSVGDVPSVTCVAARSDRFRPFTHLRASESFACSDRGNVALVEDGALAIELETVHGAVLHLMRLTAGEVALPLDPLATPAAVPSYRAVSPTRIAWVRRDAPGMAERIERVREMLLAAAMRQLTQLGCLPASHRLYVELLRHGDVALPSHGELATRACTTRETISREISLLRRDGVVSKGRSGIVLAPSELIRRIARALGVGTDAEAWESIGLSPLAYEVPHRATRATA